MDNLEQYEADFDPMRHDRQARRKRKPKAVHQAKKSQDVIMSEISDGTEGLEGGFNPTYKPQLFEEGWLLNSLRSFYETETITDILGRVKGGKEASVYRCAGHPITGHELLAAKVYRPRMFRNLSNDAMYREGREVLSDQGHVVKKSNNRVMRALGKKTGFGLQVAQTSWLMYEYTTLQNLYAAGAAVPQPIAASDNAILMSYHGDETRGAPTLHETALPIKEAKTLFNEVIRNIELLLKHGVVHGDLSPYNILYENGKIVIIDFPQVVYIQGNASARAIFQRDITRVCDYFESQGVETHAYGIFKRLWSQYGEVDAAILEELRFNDEERRREERESHYD
jgi:RIO kinase 1